MDCYVAGSIKDKDSCGWKDVSDMKRQKMVVWPNFKEI